MEPIKRVLVLRAHIRIDLGPQNAFDGFAHCGGFCVVCDCRAKRSTLGAEPIGGGAPSLASRKVCL
jgi:hypothetical protein